MKENGDKKMNRVIVSAVCCAMASLGALYAAEPMATAEVSVDGRKGERVAGCGHQFNPHSYALGCSTGGEGFFCGRLADIKVSSR